MGPAPPEDTSTTRTFLPGCEAARGGGHRPPTPLGFPKIPPTTTKTILLPEPDPKNLVGFALAVGGSWGEGDTTKTTEPESGRPPWDAL